MDWPQISNVLSIRPITDEKPFKDFIKNKKQKPKTKKEKEEKPVQEETKGKINIYV